MVPSRGLRFLNPVRPLYPRFQNPMLTVVKLVIWNFFPTPPHIWVEFWGHPQPHGGPQHQQGQELIFEHTYFIEEVLLGMVKSLKLFPDSLQTSGWSSGAIPIPMGDPNISKARDWFKSILHRRYIVRHSKISHLKLFPDPPHTSGWSSGAIPIPMGNPNISKARVWF